MRISGRNWRHCLLYCLICCISLSPHQFAAQSGRPANSLSIQYGQTASGELSTPGNEALYLFTAQQSDAITVSIDSSDFDPFVILLDPTQQNVLTVASGSHATHLHYVIPQNGSYLLKVTKAQSTNTTQGKYQLSLTLDNPTPTPSPNAAAPVVAPFKPGGTIKADLNDTARFHIYSLRARSGDPLSFKLDVDTGLQVGLYLYDVSFTNRLGTAELGQQLDVVAPTSSLYFLIVARLTATGTGTFTLHQIVDASVISIAPGQTVRGTISDDNPVKTYNLQGKANQPITARMRALSGGLDVYVYIVATDSGKVISQGKSPGEATAIFPADGLYAVISTRVGQASGKTTGNYALTVIDTSQLPKIPDTFKSYLSIAYGDQPTGKIDSKAYVVPYTFPADAGDILDITMIGHGTLAAALILQNANGDTIAQSDAGTDPHVAHLTFKIAQSGYYGLLATRLNAAKGKTSGSYDLTLTTADPSQISDTGLSSGTDAPPPGAALIAGQAQPEHIGPAIGELYNFAAQANTAIEVNVTATFPLITVLTDSDFQQIAATGGPIRKLPLPHAGTYFIFVMRRGGPNDPTIGDYTVALSGSIDTASVATTTQTAAATTAVTTAPLPATVTAVLTAVATSAGPTVTPIAYGSTVSDTINARQFAVYYGFQGSTGDVVTIHMGRTTVSSLNPALYLYFYGQQPTLVSSASGRDEAVLTSVSLPQTGPYLIVATRPGAANGTGIGNFILTLSKGG